MKLAINHGMLYKSFDCLTFLSIIIYIFRFAVGRKAGLTVQETEIFSPPKANVCQCGLKYEVHHDRRLVKGVHQHALSPNMLKEVMNRRHWRQGVVTNLLLSAAYVCKVSFIKIIYVAVGFCGNQEDSV